MSNSNLWPNQVGQLGGLACLLEATAPKPGNVHRGADFEDLTYLDFATSALAISPALAAAAGGRRLGPCVRDAISATRQAVATNTNLGAVLLLVPLAMVPRQETLRAGVRTVLGGLDAADTQLVYEAIRLAMPGGLGKVDEADITDTPPDDLLYAMRLAADRDLVARQYTNNFAEVFDCVLPELQAGVQAEWPLADTIVYAHLKLLSLHPDSLIAQMRCADRRASNPRCPARAGRRPPGGIRLSRGPGRSRLLATCRRTSPQPRHLGRSDHGRFVRGPARRHNRDAVAVLRLLVETIVSEQFHVRIAKESLVFSAAHFITFAGNICERLHGHNYKVAAEVHGPLDENQYVVDFIAVRDALRAIVDELDHRMLLPTGHPTIRVSAGATSVEVSFEDAPLGFSARRLRPATGRQYHGRAARPLHRAPAARRHRKANGHPTKTIVGRRRRMRRPVGSVGSDR